MCKSSITSGRKLEGLKVAFYLLHVRTSPLVRLMLLAGMLVQIERMRCLKKDCGTDLIVTVE